MEDKGDSGQETDPDHQPNPLQILSARSNPPQPPPCRQIPYGKQPVQPLVSLPTQNQSFEKNQTTEVKKYSRKRTSSSSSLQSTSLQNPPYPSNSQKVQRRQSKRTRVNDEQNLIQPNPLQILSARSNPPQPPPCRQIPYGKQPVQPLVSLPTQNQSFEKNQTTEVENSRHHHPQQHQNPHQMAPTAQSPVPCILNPSVQLYGHLTSSGEPSTNGKTHNCEYGPMSNQCKGFVENSRLHHPQQHQNLHQMAPTAQPPVPYILSSSVQSYGHLTSSGEPPMNGKTHNKGFEAINEIGTRLARYEELLKDKAVEQAAAQAQAEAPLSLAQIVNMVANTMVYEERMRHHRPRKETAKAQFQQQQLFDLIQEPHQPHQQVLQQLMLHNSIENTKMHLELMAFEPAAHDYNGGYGPMSNQCKGIMENSRHHHPQQHQNPHQMAPTAQPPVPYILNPSVQSYGHLTSSGEPSTNGKTHNCEYGPMSNQYKGIMKRKRAVTPTPSSTVKSKKRRFEDEDSGLSKVSSGEQTSSINRQSLSDVVQNNQKLKESIEKLNSDIRCYQHGVMRQAAENRQNLFITLDRNNLLFKDVARLEKETREMVERHRATIDGLNQRFDQEIRNLQNAHQNILEQHGILVRGLTPPEEEGEQ